VPAEATAVVDFLEDIPVVEAGWAEAVEEQALPTVRAAAVDYSADAG
jgi:hypothetical protein